MPTIIPQDKIDEVRMASDVVDIVSGYLTLQKRGKNYFGLCPFHQEKTPSFSVNADLQIFHCFGCGAGGNVFTFIMKIERLTFPETVRMLAKAAGVLLPEEGENIEHLQEKEALYYANKLAFDFFQKNLLEAADAKPAQDYLKKRGLDKDCLTEFGIGYAPNSWDGLLKHARSKSVNPEILHKAGLVLKNESGEYYDRFRGRVTFAIHDLSKQVVAFGARRLLEDNSPKYINSPETDIYRKRYILYGLHLAREFIRKMNSVILVEGYTDRISMDRIDFKNTVATSGTAMTEEHVRLLRRYTSNAVLLYDSDSAGAAAAERGAEILLAYGFDVKICTLPSGQDPDEFARTKGQGPIRELLTQATPLMDYKIRVLEKKGLLRTANQKAQATRELITAVAKMNDPIQKSYMLRDLAEKLKLEESTLWREVHRQTRQNRIRVRPEQEEDSSEKFFENRRGAAELGLLQLALTRPNILSTILSRISHQDITHPEIREIFRQIEMDHMDSEIFDTLHYVANIQDAYIAKSLSRVLQTENYHTQPGRFLKGCLNAIRMTNLDQTIENIRNRIRAGEDNAADLDAELNQLWQQREELKEIIQEPPDVDDLL